jgi:hypothetical protein
MFSNTLKLIVYKPFFRTINIILQLTQLFWAKGRRHCSRPLLGTSWPCSRIAIMGTSARFLRLRMLHGAGGPQSVDLGHPGFPTLTLTDHDALPRIATTATMGRHQMPAWPTNSAASRHRTPPRPPPNAATINTQHRLSRTPLCPPPCITTRVITAYSSRHHACHHDLHALAPISIA